MLWAPLIVQCLLLKMNLLFCLCSVVVQAAARHDFTCCSCCITAFSALDGRDGGEKRELLGTCFSCTLFSKGFQALEWGGSWGCDQAPLSLCSYREHTSAAPLTWGESATSSLVGWNVTLFPKEEDDSEKFVMNGLNSRHFLFFFPSTWQLWSCLGLLLTDTHHCACSLCCRNSLLR